MELELIRTYFPSGTNGKILLLPAGASAKAGGGRLLMYSIELPWKNNHARVSCIPEGRYELVKRWSPKFNPVSLISGAGKGLRSRQAVDALVSLVYGALDLHDRVFLNIKSDPYDFG